MAVQEAIARERKHVTICENPPAYDPQANSEVKAQMRAVKIGLEMHIKKAFDPGRAILGWMIPHSTNLINRFLVGSDGRTPY